MSRKQADATGDLAACSICRAYRDDAGWISPDASEQTDSQRGGAHPVARSPPQQSYFASWEWENGNQ